MPAAQRSYHILVVEDNPGDAHLIREAFRECSQRCDLSFAESTEAAKELLESRAFDLVLSDMGVRNAGSADFIRGIRSDKRLKSLPIIVLSGAPDPVPAYEAGANAFIAKTMDMDQFFSKIKALMHFWVDVAELPRPSDYLPA